MKHLDPEDHDEMQEGETIQAFWSADKKFYEAEIIKISGECFKKKLEEGEGVSDVSNYSVVIYFQLSYDYFSKASLAWSRVSC